MFRKLTTSLAPAARRARARSRCRRSDLPPHLARRGGHARASRTTSPPSRRRTRFDPRTTRFGRRGRSCIRRFSASAGQSISAGDRIGQSGTLVPYTSGVAVQHRPELAASRCSTAARRSPTCARVEADVTSRRPSRSPPTFALALQVKTQYNAALAANEQLNAARAQLAVAQAAARHDHRQGQRRRRQRRGLAQQRRAGRQRAVRDSHRAAESALGERRADPSRRHAVHRSPRSPSDTASIVRCRRSTAPRCMGLALDGPAIRQNEAQIASANASLSAPRRPRTSRRSALGAELGGNGTKAIYGFGQQSVPVHAQRRTSTSAIRSSTASSARTASRRRRSTSRTPRRRSRTTSSPRSRRSSRSSVCSTTPKSRCGFSRTASARAKRRCASASSATRSAPARSSTCSRRSRISSSARQTLIQARLNYRNARAQIEAVIGRDLP